MSKKTKIAAVVALCVLATAGLVLHHQRNASRKIIKVSGNIEGTDVRLSFRVPGKIKELLVDEGFAVKAGGVVATLATDELEKIKAEAEAFLNAAQAAHERARDDYSRLENLFRAGSSSEQKRDAAKTGADSAKANMDALRASLDLANTRLGFAQLTSPSDGFIQTKTAEVGEVVQAGSPVFVLVNLRDIWLTAYIQETDLGRVKLNQSVDIRTDTTPEKIYGGRISFISQEAEFTPKQIQTTEERTKLVFRIKVKVDNTNLELKPGMPADGTIRTE